MLVNEAVIVVEQFCFIFPIRSDIMRSSFPKIHPRRDSNPRPLDDIRSRSPARYPLRYGDSPVTLRSCTCMFKELIENLSNAQLIGTCIVTMSMQRFYGVMVSTLDSESSDPSSNLGRT